MNHHHTIVTSDAGSVWVEERHLFWGIHTFARHNVRPVSPSCQDNRIERGIRIGTWCPLLRRTKREHKAFPTEWMETPL